MLLPKSPRAIICALILGSCAAFAQPSFDAASLKPAGPRVPGPGGGLTGGPGTADPGRISGSRIPLGVLLGVAYGVNNDQISGPGWLYDFSDSHVVAITATMPSDTTREQYQLMLQNLLKERFHLTLHHENRDFPGYDLVLSGGGTKLKEWDPNSPPPPANIRADADGFPILPLGSKSRASIGMRMAEGGGTPTATLTTASYRETMAEFATGLGFLIRSASGGTSGSPAPRVTDKTGLTGIYEFHLRYATANMSAAPTADDDAGLGGETLFNALSSQLGLKLQKAKSVPVDVIVIDHADAVPADN
jgi:uncharacterized protein (TIGR03435 family)